MTVVGSARVAGVSALNAAYLVLLSMSKTAPYARIAITLPETDLASADRLAREQDRSRSWIIAEAIRRYVAAEAATEATPRVLVQPYVAPPAGELATQRGLGDSRRAQLISDLALTPEQRVRAAEETLRLSELKSPARRHQLIAFERYEDFLDYKRRRDIQW